MKLDESIQNLLVLLDDYWVTKHPNNMMIREVAQNMDTPEARVKIIKLLDSTTDLTFEYLLCNDESYLIDVMTVDEMSMETLDQIESGKNRMQKMDINAYIVTKAKKI